MNKDYATIKTLSLDSVCQYIYPPHLPEVVHLEDPVDTIMVNFSFTRPQLISDKAPIDEASDKLKNTRHHVLLVHNDNDYAVGLLSSEDTLGEKPLHIIREKKIKREHILTKMLMQPLQNLASFTLESLRHAKVGDIIKTLHELKQHNALVVKDCPNHEGQRVIYGLFALSSISKQLGKDVMSGLGEAQSIAQLKHDLDHDLDG